MVADDVSSLRQTLDPAQQGQRTINIFCPKQPAEHQLRVELSTARSGQKSPPTLVEIGKQRAQRLRSDALKFVHRVNDQEDGRRLNEKF